MIIHDQQVLSLLQQQFYLYHFQYYLSFFQLLIYLHHFYHSLKFLDLIQLLYELNSCQIVLHLNYLQHLYIIQIIALNHVLFYIVLDRFICQIRLDCSRRIIYIGRMDDKIRRMLLLELDESFLLNLINMQRLIQLLIIHLRYLYVFRQCLIILHSHEGYQECMVLHQKVCKLQQSFFDYFTKNMFLMYLMMLILVSQQH